MIKDVGPSRPIWERFAALLPIKPYACDVFERGPKILSVVAALRYKHIQVNLPFLFRWLVFDVDQPNAAEAWEAANLPAPNIIVGNPINGHAHLFWGLETPVAMDGREGPIKLFEAVRRGMTRRLGADQGYAGFLAKNPLHRAWRLRWLAPKLYSLADLAAELSKADMRPWPPNRRTTDWFGRNCELFERGRMVGYELGRVVPAHQLRRTLEARIGEWNADFSEPLPQREVRSIAKSIARFVEKHFSPERFAAIQAERGRSSGESRREAMVERRAAISTWLASLAADNLDMVHCAGQKPVPTAAEIAERFNVSLRTAQSDLAAIAGTVDLPGSAGFAPRRPASA